MGRPISPTFFYPFYPMKGSLNKIFAQIKASFAPVLHRIFQNAHEPRYYKDPPNLLFVFELAYHIILLYKALGLSAPYFLMNHQFSQ